MDKGGFVWTKKHTTLSLIIGIALVAVSTLGVITYSYIVAVKNTPSGSLNGSQVTTPEIPVDPLATTPTHLTCISNTCTKVSGVGVNTCSVQGASCNSVTGGGSSSGSSSGGGNTPSVQGQLTIRSPTYGQTFGYNNSILLNYTISNNTASACWYNIDSGSSQTLANCNLTYFNASSGSHTVNVYANVSGGKLSDSSSFSISLNAPSISLVYPANNTYVSVRNVNFSHIPSDNPQTDLSYCELWGNFPGAYGKNQTNTTVTSDVNNIFTLSLSDRSYSWAVSCVDKQGNRATTDNATFVVDTVAPLLTLSQPKGIFNRSSLIPLNFSVQDSSPPSCWFNVTPVAGGASMIARSVQGCMNTTFNIQDGNYTLALQTQAAGLTTTTLSNFVVNTSGIASLLSFLPPTPSDGTIINGSEFIVNVSAGDSLSRYVAVDFNSSLVSWVRMDDTVVDGGVVDISSYGNVIDTIGTRVVGGRWGSALGFTNSTDGLKIRDSIQLNPPGAFSVSFWFNGNASSVGQFLIGKWDGTTANDLGWQITLATGGICNGLDFYVSQDGTSANRVYARICNQTYQDGQWHHVVGVFEPGKNITLYVDKNSTGATVVGNISAVLSVHQNNEPIYVGSRSSESYNGSIDEILMFNRALTGQEAGALFGAGNSPYFNKFSSLGDGIYSFKAFSVNSVGVQNQTEKRTVTIIGGFVSGCGGLGCSPPIVSRNNLGGIVNLVLIIHLIVLAALIASFVYMRRKEIQEEAIAHYAGNSQMLTSARNKRFR